MNETLQKIITKIMMLAVPYIKELIESKVVPLLKRKAYEKVNSKIDALIEDLAQNASKILSEENDTKKAAYIEGSKLGVDTLRILSEKLAKAANEIEKVIV